MKPLFKREQLVNSGGNQGTVALFRELSYGRVNNFDPILTLNEADKDGYISARRIYLECNDVTEYAFAMRLLGSWSHWKKMQNTAKLKPYIKEWREELEAKLRSEAVAKVIEVSQSDSTSAVGAARYIADKGWDITSKRGRPSKDEVEREKKTQAKIKNTVSADLKRLGLRH